MGESNNWLQDLFINEAKPALTRHSGGSGIVINNQNKTFTENGTYTADSGYTGLGTVQVNVPIEIINNQDMTVTENGTYTADEGYSGLGEVTVNVDIPEVAEINNQDKTITENGTYTADEGYTGLGQVVVNVPSSGGDNIDALLDKSATSITTNATTIGRYALYECQQLVSANCPLVTSIGASAFNTCHHLTSINMPLVANIGNYAFSNCALTSIDCPLLTSIGENCFNSCALSSVNLPLVATISASAFNACSNLVVADLPLVSAINARAFRQCTNLKALILRNTEQICTVSATDVFTSTPIASGTGYIYVPRAFLSDEDSTSDYRQATNWSTYAAQFRALEDFTVDGTVTGALDETKI